MSRESADLRSAWRKDLDRVIFGVDTRAGRAFDAVLLVLIFSSTFTVLLESVPGMRREYGRELRSAEWFFTVLFTAEYVLRIVSARRPVRYIFSFFGLVDLLAIVPTYLSLFVAGTQSLAVIRAVRMLRVFRVLKLSHYLGEARILSMALRRSRPKITVFLVTVLTVVLIVGALMYLIEGEKRGFTSIPISMYWAIVTMTTVGYGDIAPETPAGRVLASILMILGYGIIAVPTGIVSVELAEVSRRGRMLRTCSECGLVGHDADAIHCKYCGMALTG